MMRASGLQATHRLPLLPNFLNSLRISNGYGDAKFMVRILLAPPRTT